MKSKYYFILLVSSCGLLFTFFSSSIKPEQTGYKSTNGWGSTISELTKVAIVPKSKSITDKTNYDVSCVDINALTLSTSFLAQKKAAILGLLEKIKLQNLRRPVIDSILIESSIGIYKGHIYLRGDDVTGLLHLNSSDFQFMNRQQSKMINEFIKHKNIDGLLKLYVDQKVPLNKMVLINAQAFTQFQVALLITNDKSIPEYQLENYVDHLLDIGAAVSFSDLAIYTENAISIDIIKKLSNKYKGNLNQAFIVDGEIHTLVTLAVKNADFQTTNYWLAENITPSPLKFRDNAIDYLSAYTNKDKLEKMLLLLIDHNVSPNNSKTYGFLARKLSRKFKQKNRNLVTILDYRSLTRQEHNIINRNVSSIFLLAIQGAPIVSNCVLTNKNKRALVNRIMSYEHILSSTNTINVTPATKSVANDEILIPKQADNLAIDINQNKDDEAQSTISPQAQADVDLLEKIGWKAFLNSKFKNINISEQKKLRISFSLALVTGASSTDLIGLIEQGAPIDPALVSLIVDKAGMDVINALYAKGYDFNYTYPDGSNAVFIAVTDLRIDVLKFLISIGVDVHIEGKFGNPLSMALLGLRFNKELNFAIVNILIDAGVEIKDVHKKYVNSLFSNNLKLYLRLVNAQPDLKL